jgi:hypothetical protein
VAHEKTAERKSAAKSEDIKTQPRAETGKFEPKAVSATTCGENGRDYKSEQASKTATTVAKEAGVNRGSVERMDRLEENRPDLADKVASGEMKPTQAMREMKKDEVVKKIAALPDGKYRVIYARASNALAATCGAGRAD